MSLRDQLKKWNVGMNRATVSLSPHDANWSKAFKEVEIMLREKIPTGLDLHHIGSTSIPGIHAKPILDILGVVPSIEVFDAHQSTLESLGFVYKGEYGIPHRRYCVLYDENEKVGLIHLHVFAKSNSEVERHLVFRDYLRSSPDAAYRYEDLKKKLAQSFAEARTSYSEGKAKLITQLLEEAIHWKNLGINKPQVVAAVIKRDNKFLLGKRALTKKSAPGLWSPICGRIEANETSAQAIEREVLEEVGLVIQPIRQVAEFATHDKSAWIIWWAVKILSGEPQIKNNEHSEIRWLSINEMEELAVFAEDIELFRRLETIDL